MTLSSGAAGSAQTLAPVLAQDGVDADVVIVDEGSTDETPEMLQRMPQDRLTLRGTSRPRVSRLLATPV